MKSHFLRIITLLTVFLPQLLPAQTFVGSYTSEGDPVYYTVINTTQKTCRTKAGTTSEAGHTGLRGDLPIPEKVICSEDGQEYTVVEVGSHSFSSCDGLTGYSLPETIKTIQDYAFYNCTGLKCDIQIPGNLIYLGAFSFNKCQNLTGPLIIPDGIIRIPQYAFWYCENIESVKLPSKLQTIETCAFRNCHSLSGPLELPETLTTLAVLAFEYCTKLTGDLIIPEGVKVINDNVFHGCSGFNGKLEFASDVETIARGAFSGCSGLVGPLDLPSTVSSIGANAFQNCSNLTGELPSLENLSTIEANIFSNCQKLTGSIILPTDITSLGESCFNNCSGLTGQLAIPETVKTIGESAFAGCTGLTGDLILPEGLTSMGVEAFKGCAGFTGDLRIPDAITSIANNVFQGCSGFDGVLYLPESLTRIGTSAFNNCVGLKGSITFPETLKEIGSSAFHNCSGLTGDLLLPDAITRLNEYAFDGCSGFNRHLKLPANLKTISQCAFRGCKGLIGELDIPETVTTIGQYAFADCSGLTGVLKLPNVITEIGWYTFSNCSGFTGDLILPDGIKTIGSYAFQKCKGFNGILHLPEELNEIQSYAFTGCSGFTGDLKIPDNVTSIGNNAFQSCSGFNGSLILPNSIKGISTAVFSGCSGLSGELNLPEGLTSIGVNAFSGCSGFTGNIKFPANLISLGNTAFYNCTGFDGRIIFNERLKTIGSGAFNGCTNLTGNLEFTESLISIGGNAFQNCSGLKGDLYFPQSITSLGQYVFFNCTGLASECIFTEKLESVGKGTFSGCNAIKKYVSPNPIVPESDATSFPALTPKAKLYVPAEAVDDYKAAPGWRNLEIEAIVECESISLSNNRLYMNLGASEQLAATIEPEDITDPRIFWESSDPSVATVDAQGRVTLLTDGVAEIKARCGAQVAVCQVAKYVPVSALKLSEGAATVIEGRELALVATVEPENATYPQVTWESSDPAVATVDAYGTVTGVSVGETTVTARAENIEAVCKLSVLPIPVETVELDATAIVIHIGSTTQLSATVGPDNAADKTITWASDNEAVASVDANGLVTAMSVGKANVTATSHNGIAATCEVTVIPVVATGLQMSDESMTLTPDASKKLTVTIQPENTTDRSVTWKSSNTAVAEVDSEGKVTALSVGTATITATSHNGLTATCDVTVEPVEATAIELSHTVVIMDYADKVTLTATVLPENATDKTVTWESSNTAVAKVDSDGNVTAVAAGTATITATCGNATATCEVTVNPVEAREVNLSDTELALYCGDTHQLTTTVLPEYTTDKTVTWESSNPSVATVSLAGLVTAADRGQAIVTATCGSVSATCIVTVSYQHVIINEIEYEINPATDPATASVCGGEPNGNGELNIPSPIQWNDVEYNVISIAPQAFADDAITSVVLPETMQTVGNQAFALCPNIATVTALSTTPPTMDDDGFAADVYNNAQLKVVGSAVTDYQNAPGWRSFATIKDKDGGMTGIADAATTEAVTIHDGKITAHTTIKVLTLNGLTIATLSEGTTIDTLPAGYYIIVAPVCAIKVRL